MKRQHAELAALLLTAAGVAALALACLLFWLFGSGRSSSQTLLQRVQAMHHLESLQAQLIATQVFRQGSTLPFGDHEVIVVARGRAVYGVNLQQAHIERTAGALRLELTRIEVLHVILNPTSIEFLAPHKPWFSSQQEFELFRQRSAVQMQTELNQQARSPELMIEAEKQAVNWLKSWLEGLGHKRVSVVFRYPQRQP